MSNTNKKATPLEISDCLFMIGQYIPPRDMPHFLSTNKRIKSEKNKILFYQKKKVIIIVRFMKKAVNIFNKIKNIKAIDDKSRYGDKPTISTSKTMALYYVKYYEKKYTKPWFNYASRHNYNNVPNIVDNTIENPSKYDLFKLQLQISLDDLICIGW